MAVTKYLLPALAAISTAHAACSVSATTTVTDAAGASALATCTTFSGSVAVQTGAASNLNTVSFDGVKVITGALSYQDDSQVQNLRAGQLQSVGDLQLGNLTALSTLSMPALSQCNNLNFTSLSALAALDFGTPGLRKAASILITNTNLASLKGISQVSQVDSFSISNNRFLAQIALDVTAMKGSIDIGANEVQSGGQTIDFPNLQTADQMTFRNASKINLPSLSNVTQNLGFYQNTIQTLMTPNLTFAGGIVFVYNSQLTNITMPLLTTINGTNGTYQIANNTKLTSIDGFENLSNVKGSLDFSGNFTSVNLPKLQNVGGAMNVQTSANFNCDPINAYGTSQVVKGAITCAGQQSTPGSAGSTPTGSGSSTSSSAAAIPLRVPAAIGGGSLLAWLLMF